MAFNSTEPPSQVWKVVEIKNSEKKKKKTLAATTARWQGYFDDALSSIGSPIEHKGQIITSFRVGDYKVALLRTGDSKPVPFASVMRSIPILVSAGMCLLHQANT